MSNAVCSQGIPKNRFYSEAKRVFNSVGDYDRFITIRQFMLSDGLVNFVNNDLQSIQY